MGALSSPTSLGMRAIGSEQSRRALLSLSLSLALSLSHTYTHTHTHKHTHTLSLSLTHTHEHTHTFHLGVKHLLQPAFAHFFRKYQFSKSSLV